MAEILELYATGQMEHSEDTAAKTMATQPVAELAVDIAKLTSKATVGSPPVGQTIREAWETHDLEWRRRLLDLLIEKVIVRPTPKTPGYAPPSFRAVEVRSGPIEVRWKA